MKITKTCKEKREEMYIGKRFGNLIILRETGLTKFRKPIVECQCDCGRIISVILGNIKFRNIRRCNVCKYVGMKKHKQGEVGLNRVIMSYRKNAESRGLDFLLSKDEVRMLTSSNCYFCGSEPRMVSENKDSKYMEVKEHTSYKYNGIDRLNPKIGYLLDNCVPCCNRCNLMKLDYTVDEFLNHIKKILEFKGA